MDGTKKKTSTSTEKKSTCTKKKSTCNSHTTCYKTPPKRQNCACPSAPKRPSLMVKKSARGNDRPSARFMYDHGITDDVFYDSKWHYMVIDKNNTPTYKAYHRS